MSLDPRPLLPRPAADPENLRRLREQASARMRQDETPVLVTRRWSLQRFALLAAAFTPAAALLRAKPAFAETGARCPAPQYGAPAYPAPRTLSQPPPPIENTQPAPAHNGLWWNGKSHDYHDGFIIGYRSGQERVARATDIKKFKSSELVEGLDHFYKDFRNRSIMVDEALPYVMDELRGVPDDKLATEVQRLRAAAAHDTSE